MPKKTKLIGMCIITALMLVVVVYLCILHSQKKEENSLLINDLTTTLTGMREGINSNDVYLLQAPENRTFSSRTEVAQAIADLVTFEIRDVDIEEGFGTAHIVFFSPNAVMILDIASEDGVDTDDILFAFMKRLATNNDTVELPVTIELTKLNGHWYMSPNTDVINAFSGGLLNEYISVQQQELEKALEEFK